MVQRARLAGMQIDTDLDVALTARGHIFFATLDGFENLDLLEDAQDGVNVGFLHLSDDAVDVPAGYYVVRFDVNGDASRPPEERDAVAVLISDRGDSFRLPLVIDVDPNPERGPRKGLSTEGGNLRNQIDSGLRFGRLLPNPLYERLARTAFRPSRPISRTAGDQRVQTPAR
jgi:hypothetical protein